MSYYEEEGPPAESIYGWIKEEEKEAVKPARYKSKFSAKAGVTASTFGTAKKGAGTFGRAGAKEDPKKFLRAGAKTTKGVDPKKKPAAKFVRKDATGGSRKAAVPKRGERPLYGLRTSKNFVVSNAVENILAAPQPRAAAQPDYMRKSDYGKAPAYLDDVKREITEQNEFIREMIRAGGVAEDEEYEEVKEIDDSERTALIKALKAKWDEVNQAYQLITFKRVSSSNSTVGAIRRKEECEAQLAQLEKDIAKLESRGPLYVVEG